MISANGNSANKTQRSEPRRRIREAFSPAGGWRKSDRVCAGAAGGISRTSGASSRARTDLRARSDIFLFSSRARGTRIFMLDRLAQVFLHDRKLCDHLFNGLALHAGERGRHQFIAQVAKTLEHWPGGRRQIEPLGAAVIGIGAAL